MGGGLKLVLVSGGSEHVTCPQGYEPRRTRSGERRLCLHAKFQVKMNNNKNNSLKLINALSPYFGKNDICNEHIDEKKVTIRIIYHNYVVPRPHCIIHEHTVLTALCEGTIP